MHFMKLLPGGRRAELLPCCGLSCGCYCCCRDVWCRSQRPLCGPLCPAGVELEPFQRCLAPFVLCALTSSGPPV